MTADDINKLQVIQNSLNRLLTGARKGTPTKDLLERTDRMSIMQMVAYHTLTMVHKVIQTGKPEYIANKLEVVNGTELERRAWGGTTIRVPRYNLEVSRAGSFHYHLSGQTPCTSVCRGCTACTPSRSRCCPPTHSLRNP